MTKRLSVGDKKVRLRRPVPLTSLTTTPVYGSVTPWHRWVGYTPAHPHEEVRSRACAALTDGCGVGAATEGNANAFSRGRMCA